MNTIEMKKKEKNLSNLSVPEIIQKQKKEITENINKQNKKKRNSLVLITNNLLYNGVNKSDNCIIYIENKNHRGSNASMQTVKLKQQCFNAVPHRFSKEMKKVFPIKDRDKINSKQIKNNPKLKINPNRRVSINLVNLELENFRKTIKIMNTSICKKKKKKQMKKERKKFEKRFRCLIQKFAVCDSLDESESDDDENDYSELVISSQGNFIFIFDLMIIICTLIVFIFAPLNIAKSHCFCEKNESLFNHVIIYFIDIIYILDLFISFFRDFYDYEYKIVNSIKEIFFNNLKNGFILDLIEAVPFKSISKFICKNNVKINQCYRYEVSNFSLFLKICLTFKILKIMKIIENKKNRALDVFYEYISKNFYLEQKIQLLIFILECLLALHLFICFQIFLGYQNYPNWIIHSGMEDRSFLNIYITSFYYTITTMTTVGYGDITCVSFAERNFQIILLAIGIVAYSYIVTKISNSIKNENYIKIKLDKNKTILEEIRITYPLMPFNLYSKINKHLIKNSNNEKKNEINFLLNSLPDIIKGEVLFCVHNKYINSFKIFKGIQNSNFILSILSNFIPIISKKEELILVEGKAVEKMVFVKDGRLSLEAFVNLEDPYESIYKYLEKNFQDFSEEDENRMLNNKNNHNTNNNLCILNSSMNSKFIIDQNRSFNAIKKDLDNIIKKNNINNKSCISLDPLSNSNNLEQEIGKLDTSENEIESDDNKNIQHLKILDVRKNEHFGNIYMTLNKLAPLSLKVKSKIADIFILTKKQVLDISKNYPNIWKRITIKSYRNTISIKSMTIITLQKFCELHGILQNTEIYDLFNCYLQKNSNILSSCITVNENKGNESSYNKKNINNYDKSSIINSDILEMLKNKNLDNQSNNDDLNSLDKGNFKDNKDNISSKFSPKETYFTNKNLKDKNIKKPIIKRHSLSTPNVLVKKIKFNPKVIKVTIKSVDKFSKSCKNSEKSFKNLDTSPKSQKVSLKNKKVMNFAKKNRNSFSNNFIVNRTLKIDEEENTLQKNSNFLKCNESFTEIINATPKFTSICTERLSEINNKENKKNSSNIKSDDETLIVSKITIPTLENLPEYLREKIRKKIKRNQRKDKIKRLLKEQKNDIKKKYDENSLILDKLLDSSFNSDEDSGGSTLKIKNFDADSLRSTTYSFSIKSSYENFDKLTKGYISKYKQLQKDIKNLVKKYIKDNKNLIPGLSAKNKINKKQSRNKENYKDQKKNLYSTNKALSVLDTENENIIENKKSDNIECLSSIAENYEKFNSSSNFKNDTLVDDSKKAKNLVLDNNSHIANESDIKSSQEFMNQIIINSSKDNENSNSKPNNNKKNLLINEPQIDCKIRKNDSLNSINKSNYKRKNSVNIKKKLSRSPGFEMCFIT